MGSEDRGPHVVASRVRSAEAETGQEKKTPSAEAAEHFRIVKAAQKAQRAAMIQPGPGAEARLAALREAVVTKPVPGEYADAASLPVPVNRREFLMYAWTASIALLLAGSGVSAFFFALPRFKAGEFGGTFSVPVSQFPALNGAPVSNPGGKYWLVQVDAGYNILYSVCTHLGCLYGWSEVNRRFECPCHGSKFALDGTYIEGPAPRSLDRFEVVVQDASGNVIARSDAEGNPVPIQDPNATVLIDTGRRIPGRHHHLAG